VSLVRSLLLWFFGASLALSSVLPATAAAQVNDNGTAHAIGGYDPVAYFTDHRAVRGSEEHAFSWQGARWLFASEAHRALFAASPARYAPAYGGYCAYAVSQGRTARIDPEAWSIVGGRLFLNYSLAIRQQWSGDRDRYIRDADARWPEVRRTIR
jgi:hypothetical protein